MDWLRREERNDLSPERKFQLAEDAAKKLLAPGEVINQDAQRTLGFYNVLLVGNTNLNLDQLRLRGRDFQTIGDLYYPGKSAVLDFIDIDKTGAASKAERNVVTTRTFGKETDRHDALYVAKIDDLTNAGFEVFYAPVRTNNIHVRIVSRHMFNLDYPLMNEINLPDMVLEKLRSTFRKVATV